MVSGKDKGKTGQVVRAFPKDGKIVVAGVNVKKHHERPRKSGQKGQVVEKSAPFPVSNAMLVDPKTKKGTRVSIKRDNGKRIRIAVKSKSEV